MPYATALMRLRRQELGIKLQDFAPRVGVSLGHYKNVEYRSAPAAIEVFHRIARELAVPVGDLVTDKPHDPKEPCVPPPPPPPPTERAPKPSRPRPTGPGRGSEAGAA